MQRQVRFCTLADGARSAYATAGGGPPLVRVLNWTTHLEFDWDSPVWRHWSRELSRAHTFIRYDGRGCGLSDWEADRFSVTAWVQDLESVVNALGLERFPLIGVCRGAAIAAAFAAQHPDRVTRLILYGGYARGCFKRGELGVTSRAQAIMRARDAGLSSSGNRTPVGRASYSLCLGLVSHS